MATAGKGLPFIGKMNEYLGRILHPTVNKVGNSIAALDVKSRAYFCVNGTSTPLTVEAGSTDNLLNKTGLNAKPGDIIRILTTANGIKEFEITVDDAPNANSAILAGYLSASLAAGDTFHLLRPVHELVSSDGSTLATVISPPVQYNVKSGGVTAPVTVLEDLDTPAASKPMPVAIHSVNGAPINVYAGDLSISTSHVNDSMRLGDGTNLTRVTANNELAVRDDDINLAMGAKADAVATTDTGTFSLIALIKKVAQNLTAIYTRQSDGSQITKISDGGGVVNTRVLSSPIVAADVGLVTHSVIHGVTTGGGGGYVDVKVTPSGALVTETTSNGANLATEATQAANGVLLGPVNETAPATDTASSGLNGRLQRIAQRITSLIALLPASLGQKTMAGSLAVTLASDQSTIVVSETATTNLDTNIGAKADAVATTDTGTFSLIALIKKVAQNITAMSAKLPAALGVTTSANSLSIAPASDAIFNTKPKALTASYDENLTLTTVATFTAPANAIGGIIMADDSNAVNIRYKQGGAATTTSGLQLQPGRSERIGNGSNVSIIAQDGATSSKVFIIWDIQA